jgi:hypothetical protein
LADPLRAVLLTGDRWGGTPTFEVPMFQSEPVETKPLCWYLADALGDMSPAPPVAAWQSKCSDSPAEGGKNG